MSTSRLIPGRRLGRHARQKSWVAHVDQHTQLSQLKAILIREVMKKFSQTVPSHATTYTVP